MKEGNVKKRWAALTCVILVACGASFGQDIHFEDAKKLRPGVSTRADAEAIFGAANMETVSEGKTNVAWISGHAGYGGLNAGSKSIVLTFGPDGRYTGVAGMSATGTDMGSAPAKSPSPAVPSPAVSANPY
jgi:hypothetical protein